MSNKVVYDPLFPVFMTKAAQHRFLVVLEGGEKKGIELIYNALFGEEFSCHVEYEQEHEIALELNKYSETFDPEEETESRVSKNDRTKSCWKICHDVDEFDNALGNLTESLLLARTRATRLVSDSDNTSEKVFRERIIISEDDAIMWNGLLNAEYAEGCLEEKSGQKEDSTIETLTCKFSNGCFADIGLCSGQTDFFINPVLFNKNGVEIACLDCADEVEGEYIFNAGDEKYIVEVVVGM